MLLLFCFFLCLWWYSIVFVVRVTFAFFTNLLVSEHKELKILCEELQRSLQFTQAEVDDMKKENQNLKGKMHSLNEKNSELERKVYVLENNLQTSIAQGNNLEKKLKDTIMITWPTT